jgi:hypothetical protein
VQEIYDKATRVNGWTNAGVWTIRNLAWVRLSRHGEQRLKEPTGTELSDIFEGAKTNFNLIVRGYIVKRLREDLDKELWNLVILEFFREMIIPGRSCWLYEIYSDHLILFFSSDELVFGNNLEIFLSFFAGVGCEMNEIHWITECEVNIIDTAMTKLEQIKHSSRKQMVMGLACLRQNEWKGSDPSDVS